MVGATADPDEADKRQSVTPSAEGNDEHALTLDEMPAACESAGLAWSVDGHPLGVEGIANDGGCR